MLFCNKHNMVKLLLNISKWQLFFVFSKIFVLLNFLILLCCHPRSSFNTAVEMMRDKRNSLWTEEYLKHKAFFFFYSKAIQKLYMLVFRYNQLNCHSYILIATQKNQNQVQSWELSWFAFALNSGSQQLDFIFIISLSYIYVCHVERSKLSFMPRYDLPQALVNAKLKQNKKRREKHTNVVTRCW